MIILLSMYIYVIIWLSLQANIKHVLFVILMFFSDLYAYIVSTNINLYMCHNVHLGPPFPSFKLRAN